MYAGEADEMSGIERDTDRFDDDEKFEFAVEEYSMVCGVTHADFCGHIEERVVAEHVAENRLDDVASVTIVHTSLTSLRDDTAVLFDTVGKAPARLVIENQHHSNSSRSTETMSVS